MLITGMEPRRKSLTALYLDGEFAMSLDTETVLRAGWKIGREISDEELLELKQQSGLRRAKEKALYLLEHRDHSKKELTEKLRRVAGGEEAAAAAEQMEALGLVNDKAYAEKYAAELLLRKGYSVSRAEYELLQKGIDRETARTVLEQLAPDPVETIKNLLWKKYGRVLGEEKGRRRAVAAMQRLGYRYEEIRRAMQGLGNTLDEDEV